MSRGNGCNRPCNAAEAAAALAVGVMVSGTGRLLKSSLNKLKKREILRWLLEASFKMTTTAAITTKNNTESKVLDLGL
jgi:hypothetical protein